jgi:acyl-CoA synthetase (AMP-forming)/AMP-acid ligase II
MSEYNYENISDAVFHHAAATPDAPALICGRLTLSYGELARLVGQATVWLGQQGVKPGEHAGVAMSHSVEHIILSLALMRMGAVLIELPLKTEGAPLTALVKRFDIAVTLHDTGRPLSTAPLAITVPFTWLESLAKLTGDQRFGGDPAALKLIVLSSGSTGIQKGTIATQGQRVLRGAIHIKAAAFWHPPKRGHLVLISSAETGMISQFLICQWLLGGPVVVIPEMKFLNDLARQLRGWDDAIVPSPPDIIFRLTGHTAPGEFLLPNMRALVSSGQPLAGHVKTEIMARVTPNLFEIYGTSGYGLISCIGPDDNALAPESVGRPFEAPGAKIEVISMDGTQPPPGVTGEIRMRGPQASIGFYNSEDNERGTEKFAYGWYYPGELACFNEAGQLFIKGRMADVIKRGGETIYPTEIEEVLTRSKHVAEAAVVGRPGPSGGEDVVAFVVGTPGFRHQDVDEHVRKRLPETKRPKFIFYLDAMPKTDNGKINRRALKTAPVNARERL